jgi:tetratricopeptide (TPR) repeat protein
MGDGIGGEGSLSLYSAIIDNSSMRVRYSYGKRSLLMLGLLLASIQSAFAQQSVKPTANSHQKEETLRQTAARTLNSLGVAYFEKQQFAKAIAALEDALKYDPENQDMRTNLGMVYFQERQFNKVVETLTDVSRVRPADQRVLTALAVAHFAEGRYGESVSFYEKLALLVPSDRMLRITLAVAYKLSERPAEASRVLQQLPQNAETQAQFHVILADAYRSRQGLPAAIAEYEKALALVPTLPEVNYRLGVLHSDLHAYSKAVEAFERELRINPQSADAAYSLGAYYLNYGNDAAEARGYFETTARLNPNHLGAYLELIKMELGLGKPAEALALAEKSVAIDAENAELHYLKARALNLQGKKDLAEQELKKFEELKSK